MRHRKSFNHLSRTSDHRKAMLSNMASSLIIHKRIETTLAKAKALRSFVEPLITKSKDDSTHSRRMVFRYLQNKEAVSELFREIAKKVSNRPGGYLRILKLGARLGDNAEMCMVELVDYNENLLAQKEEKKTKTTRRGRKHTADKEKKVEAQSKVSEEVVDNVAAEEKEEEQVDEHTDDTTDEKDITKVPKKKKRAKEE